MWLWSKGGPISAAVGAGFREGFLEEAGMELGFVQKAGSRLGQGLCS